MPWRGRGASSPLPRRRRRREAAGPPTPGLGLDDATGLRNREGLREIVAAWAADATTCPVAVAYFDIDGMSHLTRRRGPESVDDLVREVAREVAALADDTTAVGRLGTSEFAVIRRLAAAGDELGDAAALDRLDHEVHDALRRVVASAHPLPLASMGLAIGDVALLRQPWTVVLMAHDLAREARRRGGNSTIREGHGLGHRLRRREDIALALHSAVTRRELRLVFQPIVDLRDRRPVAAEALVRWTSADLGAISPSEFIPLMENHRSMRLVDDWVLNRALDALLTHAGPGAAISVNASPLSLQEDGYASRLLRRVERLGLAPDRLWIEVTETALSSRPENLLRTLAELRAGGARVLLDDFGTGHSSLTTLADLPVDWLKLDGQLVLGARDSDRQRQVLLFAAQLGRSLGHQVVAEHIESAADEDLARSVGCTHGQGFLYTAPIADLGAALLLAS